MLKTNLYFWKELETDDPKSKAKEGKNVQKKVRIQSFTEHHSEKYVHFVIQMDEKDLDKIESEENGLIKFFKLVTHISENNITLFDSDGKIKKYDSPMHVSCNGNWFLFKCHFIIILGIERLYKSEIALL